jgi:Tfp pilus assembly protein PilO
MVLSLVFVVGAFVVFFDFIRPAYEEAQSVRSDQLSRKSFVETQRAAIEQVKRLIETYQEESTLQETVSAALPLRADVSNALAQISSIAANNSVGLQSFTITSPAAQATTANGGRDERGGLVKPVGTLTFQVKFVGSYDAFKSFLRDVETNIRILDVRNISFQPAGKPEQNLYVYDMTFAAYFQAP